MHKMSAYPAHQGGINFISRGKEEENDGRNAGATLRNVE
jgi:hypothetical protein